MVKNALCPGLYLGYGYSKWYELKPRSSESQIGLAIHSFFGMSEPQDRNPTAFHGTAHTLPCTLYAAIGYLVWYFPAPATIQSLVAGFREHDWFERPLSANVMACRSRQVPNTGRLVEDSMADALTKHLLTSTDV